MKVFSKEKYKEVESTYRKTDDCWLDLCDGKEVVEGRIDGYMIKDSWLVDKICEHCVPEKLAQKDTGMYVKEATVGYLVDKLGFKYCPYCGRELTELTHTKE